jgi:hypothetical protein
MKDSKSAEKSGNFIKSKIHNNSQKYSLAIYTAIRKQKFNNYKDVHKDVDELISKNEGFSSDAQRKAAFANGYEEKGKKKNESVNEAEIKWNAVDNAIVRYIKQNVKVLEKPIKARDEAGTKKMLKGFIDGLVNAQRSLKLESINEASIKGKNNKTGESFGMVIGSDKKNKQGEFEVTIRITYSSRISSYKFMFDKSSNLIAIKDYGYSMDGKFPDMSGGGSVKSVRPNPRETITQIAKVTSPAFAKKIVQHVKKVNESVNEASREAMGIAGFTGTRGSAVQKFIDDYNLNSKKLFNFVKKGKLKDRMEFVTAIAGKRGNKFQGKMVGMFGEGKDDGVPQGYNPMVESKTKESKAVQAIYKYSPKEKKVL